MQNWQLGRGSLWGSLSHTWQLERHSPRTMSFDSPSNKWKIARSCCPAEAHAHSSVHSLQHLEPHTCVSKLQAAHFPAAQSDHSPLLEKVQWKTAVVTPPLCFILKRLWQNAPFHCQVWKEQKSNWTRHPQVWFSQQEWMIRIQPLFSLSLWHWLGARHCAKPRSLVSYPSRHSWHLERWGR